MNCIRLQLSRPPKLRPLTKQYTRLFATNISRTSQQGGSRNGVPLYIIFGAGIPIVGMSYAYYSCLGTVPYTGRRRLLATSPDWEANMGHDQYKQLLQQYKGDVLPKDHRASITVQRVGSRIAAAAQKCSKDWGVQTTNNKIGSPFTYTVVRSDDANAFVLPGNHVFVLTGLFKYYHDEDELASVLGHETAHNLARHAGERVSENILMTIIKRLALVLDPSGMLFALLIPAEQLLYTLPHSREHEMEADYIGVLLASEACYDPRAAKKVFSRMKDDSEQATPPKFISTHPEYETRLTLFDQWMPEALSRYNEEGGSKCQVIRGEMKRARKLAAQVHDGKDRRK